VSLDARSFLPLLLVDLEFAGVHRSEFTQDSRPDHAGRFVVYAHDHTLDLPCARAEERTRLGEVPTTVNRLDLATGRKQFWKKLALRTYPVSPISAPSLSLPDGNNYLYEYGRTLSDPYLVNDLK